MKKRLLLISVLFAVLIGTVVIWWLKREEAGFTRLIFTSNLYGQMESCGCMSAPLGGIARLANALDLYKRNDINFKLIDTGNFFLPKSELNDHTRKQFFYKAEKLSEIVALLDYSLMNITSSDLRIGTEFLAEVKKKNSISLIASDTDKRKKTQKFPIFSKLQDGKHSIGFISLADWPDIQDDSSIRHALARLSDCNPVIALNNASHMSSDSLLEKYPEIHFVIQPAKEAFSMSLPQAGNGYILQIIERTQYLAILDLYFGADGKWINAGKMLKPATLITQNPEENITPELNNSLKTASVFGFFQIPLRDQFGENAEINRIIEAYNREVVNKNLELFQAAEKVSREQVDEDQCQECHETQYRWWLKTKHAQAYQTLYDRGQQHDLECVGCHTTGLTFNEPGQGKARLNFRPDVQCAQCHLNLTAHLESDAEILPQRNTSMNDCQACHNKTHSPDFKYTAYLTKIACPSDDTAEKTR